MKPNTLINPSLPTIPGASVMPGISHLVRVLSKAENGIPSAVLRYGNQAQAEKKRESLADCLTREGLSSAVVQVESRFLIAIFPAEYDFDQKSGKLTAKARCDARIGSPSGKRCGRSAVAGTGLCPTHTSGKRKGAVEQQRPSRPPFATVSGLRINPRNRHNHPHALAANGLQPVYCAGDPRK